MLVRKIQESHDERRRRFIREAEFDIAKGLRASDLGGMTVYVQGLIYLDCSLAIDVSQKELCAELAQGSEKLRKMWSSDGSEAGGFPSHAIRSAANRQVTRNIVERISI